MTETNKGTLSGIGAYTLWGLLPVYWKLLDTIPAIEILAHRMVWSLVFLMGLLALRNQWSWFRDFRQNFRSYLVHIASAFVLSLNWFTYIWAVNNGQIVEASLGYYINPLINVLLGVLFLKEELRTRQWLAIGFAFLGVIYLTIQYGSTPWIALTLAFSFGTYGLIRKTAPLGSLNGLTLEMLFLLIPAGIYLGSLEISDTAAFVHSGYFITGMLLLTGIATATPLLLFAYGARRIMLSTIGVLQYIAPTLQLIIGVFLFSEPFPKARFIGFILIWIALVIYTFDLVVVSRQRGRARNAKV